MNLLVTGGAGFIGSNVIHYLMDRPEIRKLVNLDCLTYAGHLENLRDVEQQPKYVFEKVDLREPASTLEVLRKHGITHVLHLAAESHVDRSISDPGNFVTTNVVGTLHLLEACKEAWGGKFEGKRLVHVSTDEVYGSLGPTGAFREESPYAPNSPYSASKASSDLLVRAYHHTYGLPVIITRCSNNYGPFQYPEKLIPVVIQSVLEGRQIPVYGNGLNVRDWIFVRDHAEALWRVMEAGLPGESYNIGGQNEWPNIRLVELLCDVIDEVSQQNKGSARGLITFVKDRPGHDQRYAIDSSKIRRELGWNPSTPFQEGIRETVRWYLANQDWVRAVKVKQ